MQSFKKTALAGMVFLAIIAGPGVTNATALSPADDREPESRRALWKKLTFHGSHFLGDATTEVSLTEVPAADARMQLISIPEGNALEAAASPVMVIVVQSKVDPLLGRDEFTVSRAWFLPDQGIALQRIRSRRGDDIWQNTYRFTPGGVYRVRKKPVDTDERSLEPAHWTKIKESFFPYPTVGPESKIVMEPTGLLHLATNFSFRSPDVPGSVYVFDRKQLHEVNFHIHETRQMKISYVEKNNGKEIKREGKRDAVKISFKPRALPPQGEKPEEFSFMGLKGDFEIDIDPEAGIPLQVSGKVSGIGKIQIRLQSIAF